jgi:hypothetical protein
MQHPTITAVIALAMLACNPRQEAVSPDLEWEECENRELGYTVAYPAGWHTNEPGKMGPCRLFHPEPFTVPHRAAIPLDIAVLVLVEEVPVEETLEVPIGKRLLDEKETTVAGRTAWRFLLHSTGKASSRRTSLHTATTSAPTAPRSSLPRTARVMSISSTSARCWTA